MTATGKMTKAKVLALAKRAMPDAKLTLEHRPNALDKEQKAAERERINERNARKAEIDARLKELAKAWQTLLDAAEFVCDADGQEPSISRLRQAAKDAREVATLRQERRDIEEANRKAPLHGEKWSLWDNVGWANKWAGGADTLEELAEQLERKIAEKAH